MYIQRNDHFFQFLHAHVMLNRARLVCCDFEEFRSINLHVLNSTCVYQDFIEKIFLRALKSCSISSL